MYVIKDFCEKSLKNLKDSDLHSLRNIFLSYGLSGSFLKDPEYKANVHKLNYYFKRYLFLHKQQDYIEINECFNDSLDLINRTLSALESELPKVSSYETVNRKHVWGFFSVKVVS